MKAHQQHMIGKQRMEINFESMSPGVGIQNEMADLFHEQLLPELNTLFDELAGDQFLISVDRIEIDCGLLSAENWRKELISQTLKSLKHELVIADKKKLGSDTLQHELQKDCLYFLEHGHLPWNSHLRSTDEFEKIAPDKAFIKKLKILLLSKSQVSERLVYQFSDKLSEKLIRSLGTEEKTDLLSPEHDMVLKKDSETEQLILKMISGREKARDFPAGLEKENEQLTSDSWHSRRDQVAEGESEGIYIENAGLIILHPFLPELFKILGLWRDKQWAATTAQQDAVYILGYLASGNDEQPEFGMMLNKIMCGLPITDALLTAKELSGESKAECDELLAEVIRHWRQLKNTSVDALRETFLRRNGKLTRTDHGWLLNIERKGVDILLGSLPWGIGTIKMSWTKDKLFVEW